MYGQHILCGISKYPLKFHTKYLSQTLKDVDFIQRWNLKSSEIQEPIGVFEMVPKAVQVLRTDNRQERL